MRIRNENFKKSFCWCSNLSNDDKIFVFVNSSFFFFIEAKGNPNAVLANKII